jgi:L-fuconolactonase
VIVDAHQHFWALARHDYTWLTPVRRAIYRDFEPADLEPHLIRNGVDMTVLVQAAPSERETQYLLDLAARTPWVAGVVGWIDLASAQAPSVIERLAQNSRLKGLRPMLQDLDDDRWLLRADIAPAIEAMIAHKLRFDALIKPRHLTVILQFAERYPALPVVIDHGAKPNIARSEWTPWSMHIRRLAASRPIFCKLSGLVTEAGPQWSVSQVAPYVEYLVQEFGASRLMWGSDWPLVEEAGGYDEWYRSARAALGGQTPSALAEIFGGVAMDFYGLAR